jgi:hypothetical protein
VLTPNPITVITKFIPEAIIFRCKVPILYSRTQNQQDPLFFSISLHNPWSDSTLRKTASNKGLILRQEIEVEV